MDRDHVHLYMEIPQKYAVSRVVEALKSASSQQLKGKLLHMVRKVYWDGGRAWA